MRGLILILTLMVSVFLVGCGSHQSYEISTGADGSLEGVRTIPRDGDIEISTQVSVRIYWPSGYEPPAEFEFTLKDRNGGKVSTHKREGEQRYEWWFEPYSDLSFDTRYEIELKSGDETASIYFWTEEDDTRSPASSVSPSAGPRTGPALPTHRIRTR